ncbi:MAG: two-component regulator propeller domain-containing protein [Bacteroidota bacterium]|nr:two-component regulator propeller domain-containing protein [Bacteroidota bacterium]
MAHPKIIAAFITLLFYYNGAAQTGDLIFKHLTRSNGLPVDGITCLAQDSSGFIWMGSSDGLIRYDGFNFKQYHYDPADKRTVPGNAISYICVTRKGLLWVGTFEGGIACMDRNGRVIRVINSSTTDLFTDASNAITTIKEDKQGNIWFSAFDGIFRISARDGMLTDFRFPITKARDNAFRDIIFDERGKIWVANLNHGIVILDTATKNFSSLNSPPFTQKNFKNKNYYNALTFYKGQIWYSTWVPDIGVYDTATRKDILLYSALGKIVEGYNLMVNSFFIDSKNSLWLATCNGLFFTTHSSKLERTFRTDINNNYSIGNNWINAILEDREGNFWFGTKEGISIAQPYKKTVRNLSDHKLKEFPFGDKEISNVIEVDSNTLLVCTANSDGIYETDLDFNLKKKYFFHDVKYDWIWTYYHDKPRSRIFISTQEGMLLYNTATHSVKKVKPRPGYNINSISSFVADSDSIIWMSRFRNSFLKYDLQKDVYKEYTLESLGEKMQNLLLTSDKDNQLWLLANDVGILRFDKKTETITQRITSDTTINSLLQTGILFFKDIGQYYLVGYQSKGVSLLNKKTGIYKHVTFTEGLASNISTDAFVAKNGKVWIATGNGLSLLDPSNKTFKNYGYSEGILNNNILSITQLRDGRIVAGTNKGVVVFDPAALDSFAAVSAPMITGINVYGRKMEADSLILLGKTLQISYSKNYVSFDFITPQYSNNERILYAYKMEGIDRDWIECGGRQYTSYSNMQGGNYVFKVRAKLPGGEWIESRNNLRVHVNTPFYDKWWFYVLGGLLAAGILYIIFRYRLQQILKLERMRTTISGDLHDEVGASLTSISIFSEMASKSVTPLSNEAQYLQRIGERSRESIEKMSDIIWNINPENDNLQQILIRMKNYSTEVAEAKDIAIHWKEEGNFSYSGLSVEQRKNFYLLFKEVINNAIKHAAAKNIYIEVKMDRNTISLHLEDDGKGYDTTSVSAGNGLKNIHRRIESLKGKINISSRPGQGTVVDIAFAY